MTSEKKASEGIALLSMYGDEDDDEMEDLDDLREEEDVPPHAVRDGDDVSDNGDQNISRQQEERGLNENSTHSNTFYHGNSSASATPQQSLFSPPQQQQQQVSADSDFNYVQIQIKKSRMLIVDYGHEEGAMSPEAEKGEITATGRAMYVEQQLQTSDGESRDKKSPGIPRLSTPSTQATPSRSLEPNEQAEPDAMSYAVNESESGGAEDVVMVPVDEQKAVDPLGKFLKPPPTAKCSEELQEKIIKFLALKKTTGRSFNSEVRNRKEYRNPDFLLHAVTYQEIDHIGSCFSKDVFDPHGYDTSDFYDEIEAAMRVEMERREQERKKSQKLDFTPGGIQSGIVAPTPKFSTQTPGLSAVVGALNVPLATSDLPARDGRQNKKSKWDKVDVDQRNSLATGGQENLSAVLSVAKASSGYAAYIQQRRKETDDKRSSDKRLDRRS